MPRAYEAFLQQVRGIREMDIGHSELRGGGRNYEGHAVGMEQAETKPNTEERSVQEALKLMVDCVNAALMNKIQEEEWEEEARNFGKNVRTVCDMMNALDCGVDVEDYPRIMFESARILESIEGE